MNFDKLSKSQMYQLVKKYYQKPELMPRMNKTDFRRRQDWHKLVFYTEAAYVQATCQYMKPYYVLEILQRTGQGEVRQLVEIDPMTFANAD